MKEMWRASEDFGWYTKRCPGAIFYIGTGEDHAALHTEAYDFPDAILPAAAAMFRALI
jgi:metal-dependent amidase/aminoacylase/carboxypeptidase family protein